MKIRSMMLLAAFACWTAGSAIADNAAPQDQAQQQQQLPPGVTPEKMEEMKKKMAPNENHDVFKPLEGKFNYTASFWMAPDAPAETMTGTSENETVYGGRFLKQKTKGTWMGEPWEGVGFTGYDNIKNEYQSVWIDGMATSMMFSTGTYDAATKTLTTSGETSCPMSESGTVMMRSETKIIDADHHTFTGYMTRDGKEFKGMEISYTRA